jgi:uncharacterized protein YdhG (YjbR/CyaY superfamily)
MNRTIHSIDDYLLSTPAEIRHMLDQVRAVIIKAAPGAEEAISYGMPTFKLKGVVVHFALCKKHIGFYPAPSGIEAFKKELSPYKTSKGAIQFPLNKPLPLDLIAKIVKFRVKENMNKTQPK